MMMQMIQIFQIKIIANQSSIFSIICNHLNKTKRKRTKQLSNTQQKNIKLQLFGWSHVDDADDTDDPDRSVTDIGHRTDDGRLTSSIFRWSPTQKALKGKYRCVCMNSLWDSPLPIFRKILGARMNCMKNVISIFEADPIARKCLDIDESSRAYSTGTQNS